mmetsp:Transcript_38106/g.91499  ORF Transcript_38106/g.91499 Transcript_38106/m.91499 type:complete len:289 (-) Transcript_38106:127-993(-)
MSSVGMMSGAFFVPRTQLIDWLNSTFKLSVTKVEQCSNGAIYCQVFDSIFTGKVQMSKLNWSARDAHECIANYKVLQQTFDRCSLSRNIPVDSLIRGKYQDNLEFLQWVKSYWEQAQVTPDYDPVARRSTTSKPFLEWASRDKENAQRDRLGRKPTKMARTGANAPAPRAAAPATKQAVPTTKPPAPTAPASQPVAAAVAAAAENVSQPGATSRESDRVSQASADDLENERDFYFAKLRSVELICQRYQENAMPDLTTKELVDKISKILYATEATPPFECDVEVTEKA